MSKFTTIYVELEEEITSVVERIKKIPSNEVVLVIPPRAHISSGLINLKILKSETEKLEKKIVVVSKDSLCRSLAQKVGLLAHKKIMEDSFKKLDKFNQQKQSFHKSSSFQNSTGVKSKPSFVKEKNPEEIKKKSESAYKIKNSFQPELTKTKKDHESRFLKKPSEKTKANKSKKPRSIDGLTKSPLPVKNKIKKPIPSNKNSADSLQIPKNLETIKKDSSFSSQTSKEKTATPIKKEKPVLKDKNKTEEKLEKIKLLPDNFFWIAGGGLLALLIIIILLLSFVFSKATIKLVLKQDREPFSTLISISTAKEEVEQNKGILAQEVENQVIAQNQFQASGEAENVNFRNKAVATVIIHNEFSTSPEALIKDTQFSTQDGLIYKLVQETFIEGYTKENGEIIPGKAYALVVAEKQGDQYLINTQEKLRIPALKEDQQRYEKIYAKFQGSVKKPGQLSTKRVTESDIKEAKQQLKKELEEKIKNKDFNFNSDLEVVEKSIEAKPLEYEIDVEPGIRVESFKASAKSQVVGLAYNRDDLKQAVMEKAALEFGENQNIELDRQIKITDSKILEDGKSMELEIECDLLMTRKIQEEKITQSLKGLEEEEARQKLDLLNDVVQFKIEFWPFWINNFPFDEKRIDLVITPLGS
ncbi:MAG: hypothetical protein GF335_03035 [Candidatus Moranbacteria bacterium]|nr:hypothetical protein [Candidatus Moranbacteria bacterium]